jgi:hypothetical protein
LQGYAEDIFQHWLSFGCIHLGIVSIRSAFEVAGRPDRAAGRQLWLVVSRVG